MGVRRYGNRDLRGEEWEKGVGETADLEAFVRDRARGEL